MLSKIKSIIAKEILTSGGTPTVEVKVELDSGHTGQASVPFGVSAGIHEAYTLIDKDPKRYNGQGMLKACNNINTTIADKLVGLDVLKQEKIDKTLIDLDGTPNKQKLGGNSILAVSLACARAGAASKNKELFQYIRDTYKLPFKKFDLPKPMMVVMEGGKHADNSTDFQEYCYSVSGAPSIREAVRWGEEAYHALKIVLKDRGLNTNVGNEGAFAPSGIDSNEKPLEMMVEAIEKAGYEPGKDIMISLDPATSEVYNQEQKKYILKQEGTGLSSDQMIGLFNDWINKYPILSIEDGLAEDDWSGWQEFYKNAGDKIKIIGDDLTVTNKDRVQKAIELKAINAVLIKLNQIGSLTETIETIMLGKSENFWNVVSHRGGGETNDSFMIDLAVAVNAEYVKVGPSRGERTSKYNRLMEIEDIIKK
ncbi:MAG: phosphopyruvate hydratase [bacterium]|nr:phosphopyruvate hydratase [bacterium]